MVDEFPGNSHAKREKGIAPKQDEKEKVVPVVQNEVRRQKASPGKRFKNMFFGGDARQAASTTIEDTVRPAIQAMLLEGAMSMLERVVYGESRPRRGGGRGGWTDYTKPSNTPRPSMSNRGRTLHDFDEIVIETRPEAEAVLDAMLEMFDRFGVVTVADFYNLVNQSSSPADRNWGWSTLQGADVVRARGGGYIVSLPRTDVLK